MRLAPAAAAATIVAAALLLGGLGRGPETAAATPFDSEAAVARGYAALDVARVRADPSRYPVAEREFDEALRLGGADAAAYRGLAALAAARHRFDDSLELADRARALNPTSPEAYALIGGANLELGRYEDAVRALDRMMELKPDASGYARVSYARELLGDLEGARDAMKLAVETAAGAEPRAWALVQLGNLHVGAPAARYHREALARVPGYAPALVALAEGAFGRGEYARADQLYRRALALAPDPGAAVGVADSLAARGRTAQAEQFLRRAHELEAVFAQYGGRNEIETALQDLNHDRNLRGALARARAGARRRPGIEGTHVLAWALYKNGRCTEGRRLSDSALRLAPNDVDAVLHRVLIERCLGHVADAAGFLERARALDPAATLPSAYRLRPRIAAWPKDEETS